MTITKTCSLIGLAFEALQVLAVRPIASAAPLVAAPSLEPAAAAGPPALHDLPQHSAPNSVSHAHKLLT